MAAAGGYYSTAADLLRFAHRVYDTDFLSRASRTALTTVEVASDNYALGGPSGPCWGIVWMGIRTVVILNNNAVSQRTVDEFAESLLRAQA